ncbi:hypothetical protein VTN02DRAFT_74 [Thermoascus thermophilus]
MHIFLRVYMPAEMFRPRSTQGSNRRMLSTKSPEKKKKIDETGAQLSRSWSQKALNKITVNDFSDQTRGCCDRRPRPFPVRAGSARSGNGLRHRIDLNSIT